MEPSSSLGVDEALAVILARDPQLSRAEPEIAANIGEQAKHMELDTRSISLRRRVRDCVNRLKPRRVIEVGAGIGHLSAWLFDIWQDEEGRPETYQLVESGGKFGVILLRLLRRYEAEDWADVKVGRFQQLAAETKAWGMASSSLGQDASEGMIGERPLIHEADLVIIDVPAGELPTCIRSGLELLSSGGVLLTFEPDTPTDDPAQDDEEGQARIKAFQDWIDLIKETSNSHHLAFQPLTGGTLVAFANR